MPRPAKAPARATKTDAPTPKTKTGKSAGNPTRPPNSAAAEYTAKNKAKPRVTNGGNAGALAALEKPLQNPAAGEPLTEPRGRSRKKREPEQICGAHGKRLGEPCRHPAGFRTDHPGSGRCWLHGGRTPAPLGRYAAVERPRVQELLLQFEADPDPLNLLPETSLLRALLADYINRFEEQDRMLTRWNLSFEKGFQAQWQEWWRAMRAASLEQEDDLSEELLAQMPDPMDFLPSKPLRMADITDVSRLINQVGGMVDRIRKAQTAHTFTMDTVTTLWKVMAGHLTDAALEVIENDELRSTFLTAVESRWGTISLAELASRRAEAGAEAG